MSWNSKVLWSEGMFLQPHHFQQHDRYLEHLVGASSAVATPHPWGVQRLTVDTELLGLGKVALVEAKGLLPDGTPFDLPADGPPPPALELDETVKEAIVYLALPCVSRDWWRPEARRRPTPPCVTAVMSKRCATIIRDRNRRRPRWKSAPSICTSCWSGTTAGVSGGQADRVG